MPRARVTIEGQGPDPEQAEKWGHAHIIPTRWKVTVEDHGRETFDYWTGPAIRDTTPTDALACLLIEAGTVNGADAESFEQWADDLGFDRDSRAAERTYRELIANRDRLASALGMKPAALSEWVADRDEDDPDALELAAGMIR